MSITPYSPTAFATPIANPAIGSMGIPYPYVSVSEYRFAPTAMDTGNLVPFGGPEGQTRSLADTLRRASAWADRYCFGSDPAAKGASLCATLSIESAVVPIRSGVMRLICDYKPIVQVNAVDVGPNMQNLSSVGSTVAANIYFGRRTIYVPLAAWNPPGRFPGMTTGSQLAVWAYVNGYPHTQLSVAITAGDMTCTVLPTDGNAGLLGMIEGETQLTIVDGDNTETFTVQSIDGTVITSVTAFQNSHPLPMSPDFIPVTSVPAEVSLAVIYATTYLIKTRGDNSLVLQEMTEPKQVQKIAGDEWADLRYAMHLLEPYRIRLKR